MKCILENTTKIVVNTEDWWGDIYCEKCFVNRTFQSMQFLNTFVRLVNVHGCMWRVSTGVLSFDDNRKIRICRIRISLPRFDVRSFLLWLICQLGLWFFNHSLIKPIIASFVPGRAVIALMRRAPERNATNGYWMKKRIAAVSCFHWLAVLFEGAKNACCPLAGSMQSHQFFLVQVSWHLTPKFGIWSYVKSTEIKSAKVT